jgi:hypothetical protein
MSGEVNKAQQAWQTTISGWKEQDRKQLPNPKSNFDRWAKLQLAMEKTVKELLKLDQAIYTEAVNVKHLLDAAERHLPQAEIATWRIMRKLISQIHHSHGEKTAALLKAMHVNNPEKLE